MAKNSFWRSLLSDERGAVSSKRFIAVFCVLILCAILVYTIICPDCKSPSEIVVDGLKYITMVSLGSSSVDKFSIKKESSSNINTDN